MGSHSSMALVFISYPPAERSAAEAACESLEHDGIRCWIAPRNLDPAVPHAGQIIQGIRESKAIVLLFSQHVDRSADVMREIEFATNQHLPVLAVRLDRTVLSDDFTYYLRNAQWHDVSTRENDPEKMADLSVRLSTLLNPANAGEKSTASAVAPARFGDFEILAMPDGRPIELGRGGMGVTYRARQLSMGGREIALKVINPMLLDDEGIRKRFLREAQIAGAIEHPNVAMVYSRGQENDSYFYAMQLVAGVDLDKYVKERGPLSVVQALSVTAQVAAALEAARAKGLIHRDIKPSNIMAVTDRRNRLRIKLIDFGLAKNVGAANIPQSVVSGDRFVGTFAFASPEQCRRQELDTRSDLYSLGVTLWFLLTGSTPFRGSPEEVSGSHLFREPPFGGLPELPAPVLEILKGLLAKDPAQRPQTPAELEDRLEEILRSLPADSLTQPSELAAQGDATQAAAALPDLSLQSLIGSPALLSYFGPAAGQTREERFHLIEELREGVSGRLFRAREERGATSREVGLKFLHPSILSDGEKQKLLHEQFDRVRSLPADHLLAHYSLELASQPPFLVREWLNGFSFGALLRWRQTLPGSELVTLLAPLPAMLDELPQNSLALIEVSLGKIFLAFPPEVAAETFPTLAKGPLDGLRPGKLKLNPLSLRALVRRSGHSDSEPTMLSTSRLLVLSQAQLGIRGKPPVRLLGQLIYELLSGYPLTAPEANGYTPLTAINEPGNRLLRAAMTTPAADGGFPNCQNFWEAFVPSLGASRRAPPAPVSMPPLPADHVPPRNAPAVTPPPASTYQPLMVPAAWPTPVPATTRTDAPISPVKEAANPVKKVSVWGLVWMLILAGVFGLGLFAAVMFSVKQLLLVGKRSPIQAATPANTETPAPSAETVEATPAPTAIIQRQEETPAQSPVVTNNFTDAFNQAQREVESKQYDKALANYTEAIRLNPDSAEAYNGRGEVYYSLKQFDKAITDYTEAIRLKPDFAQAYSNRGFAYNYQKEYDKALADCSEAIRLKPDFADAYKNRANPYNNLKQYDKAVADCDEAIRLKPDFAEAHVNRALAYVGLKQYDKAIVDCNEAIRLKPELPQSYFVRALGYGHQAQQDKAIADLTQAIRLKPDFVDAFHNRGLSYYFLKQYENAIADFSEGIRLKPDAVLSYRMRGLARSSAKQYQEAAADFSEAIRLKPDEADCYAYRAEAYNNLKQYDKAVSDCTDAIALKSDLAEAYIYRAEAYDNLRQYDKAVADASEALRLKPNSAEAHDYRAWAYDGLVQYDKAMNDCNEAIRLNPDLADAYGNRGAAYYGLQQYERAVTDLTKAINLKPDMYEAYVTRAASYANLKKYNQAITDYEGAIRLEPGHADAYASRADAYNNLKRYADAIQDCNEAIRLAPENATAYNNRGYAYVGLKQYENGISDFTQAIRLNPNLAVIYSNRAFAYQQLGQSQKAKEDRAMAEKLQGMARHPDKPARR